MKFWALLVSAFSWKYLQSINSIIHKYHQINICLLKIQDGKSFVFLLLCEAKEEEEHCYDNTATDNEESPRIILKWKIYLNHQQFLPHLYFVVEVHAKDTRDDCPKAHDEASHLDEEAHLDDLVPDTVQVRGDELVSVLDHVDEDLDLRLNLVQISRVRTEEELHFLLR